MRCALGWACWKTYVGRPETDETLGMAMNLLGTGLAKADRHADALPVREAELSLQRRVGAPRPPPGRGKYSLVKNKKLRIKRLVLDERRRRVHDLGILGRRDLLEGREVDRPEGSCECWWGVRHHPRRAQVEGRRPG